MCSSSIRVLVTKLGCIGTRRICYNASPLSSFNMSTLLYTYLSTIGNWLDKPMGTYQSINLMLESRKSSRFFVVGKYIWPLGSNLNTKYMLTKRNLRCLPFLQHSGNYSGGGKSKKKQAVYSSFRVQT